MHISRLIRGASATPPAIVPATPGNVSPGATARSRAAVSVLVQGNVLEGALVGHALGDRYQVRSVIGRGATSIVYRAFDQRLGREVAIKVLSTHAAAAEGVSFLRARFAREARMAAGIRHPNVVSIHDQGTDPSLGIDFLVMELLEGETLGGLIRKLGLPRLASTVRLLRQAAAGLAAGHRAGLVHREVKPDNFFLEASGSEVRLKVFAFGSADGGRPDESMLDLARGPSAKGLTPAFCSPEQLRGDHPLTPASDVFSLGAVAHHLLTGEHLWESIEANRALREMEASRDTLLQDRGLPLKLREVVGQALASHPADRFGDAREMLIALDAVRVGEPGETPVDSEAIETVVAVPLSAVTCPPASQGAPSTSTSNITGLGLPLFSQRLGTGFVLAMVGSICFLTAVAGQWDTIVSAMTILAAAALAPLPGESEGADGSARFLALSVATLILLGVMVARAMSGSIPDLLAAQMIISRILLWITSPAAVSQP